MLANGEIVKRVNGIIQASVVTANTIVPIGPEY
ncbi:hypothetical protein ViNHUV68_33230 [Vibrio sp. NH-UV-68]